MMFPPLIGAVSNLAALAMQAVAQCLLTLLAVFLAAAVAGLGVAALARWSLKRMLDRTLAQPHPLGN